MAVASLAAAGPEVVEKQGPAKLQSQPCRQQRWQGWQARRCTWLLHFAHIYVTLLLLLLLLLLLFSPPRGVCKHILVLHNFFIAADCVDVAATISMHAAGGCGACVIFTACRNS